MATEQESMEEAKVVFVRTMKKYLFRPKTGKLEEYPPNSFFDLWLPFCLDFRDIFQEELLRIKKERWVFWLLN